MTILNGRSVVHILYMTTMAIMILLLITESESKPLSVAFSPKLPPASLSFQPVRDHEKQGVSKKRRKHRYRKDYQIHPEDVEEDYGYWNPPPRLGGGDFAPIPHGEVS
ncbi:hypothetical protein JCGZ_04513 [Jatropha curcas]|uniref:Uncharacterized protein n=1 Tax=Jatropha curcas TaxID=180498 RepID=A0A067KUC6_JATCU|nr:hypothetical protein JCGZ_04513 [Jatropha curcas]